MFATSTKTATFFPTLTPCLLVSVDAGALAQLGAAD